MKKRSKRYNALVETVGEKLTQLHQVTDVVTLLKSDSGIKFTESIELAISLNINAKQADQLVRGSFSLPHGTGKSVKVIAFAEGEDAEAARTAGATEVGSADLVEKIQKGWLDFDVAVAHPSMMRHVGKLGKMLGPKGLMPSPKSGTVTNRVGDAVKEFSAGRIEFRNDAQGNVCVCVGKSSFSQVELAENIEAMIDHIKNLRPSAVKGDFIKNITVSTTMGPGFKIAV